MTKQFGNWRAYNNENKRERESVPLGSDDKFFNKEPSVPILEERGRGGDRDICQKEKVREEKK